MLNDEAAAVPDEASVISVVIGPPVLSGLRDSADEQTSRPAPFPYPLAGLSYH